MKKLTEQEAFDIMVQHARKQGCKSVLIWNGVGTCKYRGPNGTKCLAAALIRDEDYSEDMEDQDFASVVEEFDLDYLEDVKGLGCDMQTIHDDWPVEKWESEFKRTAAEYSLNYLNT